MASLEPEQNDSEKYIPGEAAPEKVFNFPYISDYETTEFIKTHGRVLFIIRGPPGTSKHRLSSLLYYHYPSSVLCSADNYFDECFVPKTRTRVSIKASHEFCEKRVSEECEKGTHPIIVKNSHIRIWEVRPYVHIAAKYGYTVIMAITLRKYTVNAEALENSNRKGLTKCYFTQRLRQWREYVPLYLGWFLCPDDNSFLLNQGKKVLVSLTEDEKFCNIFNTHCEEEILKYFKVKTRLFCIASHYGSDPRKRRSYLSTVVQEAYGKCFKILIQGFVISKSFFLAMAVLFPDAKHLVTKPQVTSYHSSDAAIVSSIENVKFDLVLEDVTTFEKVSDAKGQTEEIEWMPDEEINVYDHSIIVLGETENSKPITDVHEIINAIFSDVINPEGQMPTSKLSEFDNGTKYTQLQDDTWFVQSSKKIQMKTVFSGLYA